MRIRRSPSQDLLLFACLCGLASCAGPPDPGDPLMAPGISLDAPSSIEVGTTVTVEATVTNLVSDVVYSTSSPAVVTVHPTTGTVQAVSLGNATITATATADPMLTASVAIVVVEIGMVPHEMTGFVNELCPNREEQLFTEAAFSMGDVREIHEFHDCQRLIDEDAYQALVGIFAHANVGTYTRPDEWEDGRLAAVILNFKTKEGPITYEPLGIQRGTSCLILKWTKPEIPTRRLPGTWDAALIYMPPPSTENPYGKCRDDLTWSDVPEAQKGLLEVKLQPNAVGPNGTPESPPVARWDWDSVRRENYMGVRCGRVGWCEIGDSGFTQLPAIKTLSGKNLFKGFYDEQYLADEYGALSTVWGTVRPGKHASNGAIKRDGFWYEAAKIDLQSPIAGSAALSFYSSKLFIPTVIDPFTSLRKGSGSMRIHSLAGQTGKDWNVRVNGHAVGLGRMKYRHHGVTGPGRVATVRWRWHENDESVWSYCPEDGCCEMGRL